MLRLPAALLALWAIPALAEIVAHKTDAIPDIGIRILFSPPFGYGYFLAGLAVAVIVSKRDLGRYPNEVLETLVWGVLSLVVWGVASFGFILEMHVQLGGKI